MGVRRLVREALIVAACAAGVVIARAGSAVLPGTEAAGWAVDLVRGSDANAAGVWALPFVQGFGLERGVAIAGWGAFAWAAASVWAWLRTREGGTGLRAAGGAPDTLPRHPGGAVLVATLAAVSGPLVLRGAVEGTAVALVVPAAVLALWAWEHAPAAAAVLATALVGWVDGAAGLACAMAGACIGGRRGWGAAGFAALPASAAGGELPGAEGSGIDPLGAGLLALVGITALRAARRASGVGAQARWALGALAAALVTCGPVLATRGGPVALPAALLEVVGRPGASVVGAGVVAGLCAARFLVSSPRATLALAGLLAVAQAGRALATPSPRVSAQRSATDSVLAERAGSVLHLPLAVEGVPGSAPDGTNGRWAWLALATGRSLPDALAAGDDVPAQSVLLAEPAVVVSAALASGDGTILVPAGRAGAALCSVGVTDLVVHRDAYAPEVLARLDLALHALHGPPQRDLAGNVDLYRVPASASSTTPILPATVVRAGPDDARPAGMRTLAEVLGAPVPGRRPHVNEGDATSNRSP